jgi:hypothetical protein
MRNYIEFFTDSGNGFHLFTLCPLFFTKFSWDLVGSGVLGINEIEL